MPDPEAVLCPECGWTGTEADLVLKNDERQCPICAGVIEFVD